MPERRITLSMDGLDSEDGHIMLPDLIDWLRLQHQVLSGFDKAVTGRRTAKFPVVDLSHSSPATAVVEVRPIAADNDFSVAVVERYVRTIERIDRGDVPDDLDAPMLSNLRKLAAPVGRKMKRARVGSGATVIDLSERFVANIDAALARVERSTGSVEGTVEQFNAHAGANRFRIYPAVGPSFVVCHFPSHLTDRAAAAVMKKVRVYGEVKYLRHAEFPHEIEVSEIDVYEEDADLPRFTDLRGVAPDATGSENSEDFIRRDRDAWDD